MHEKKKKCGEMNYTRNYHRCPIRVADNSQIDATKVLQKHYETFIHRNIYFENIWHSKENAGET